MPLTWQAAYLWRVATAMLMPTQASNPCREQHMQCHGSPEQTPTTPNEIILVGNHNVGKSVLFGRLTGKYVTVANYPARRSRSPVASHNPTESHHHRYPRGQFAQPISDDERVTREVLLYQRYAANSPGRRRKKSLARALDHFAARRNWNFRRVSS